MKWPIMCQTGDVLNDVSVGDTYTAPACMSAPCAQRNSPPFDVERRRFKVKVLALEPVNPRPCRGGTGHRTPRMPHVSARRFAHFMRSVPALASSALQCNRLWHMCVSADRKYDADDCDIF